MAPIFFYFHSKDSFSISFIGNAYGTDYVHAIEIFAILPFVPDSPDWIFNILLQKEICIFCWCRHIIKKGVKQYPSLLRYMWCIMCIFEMSTSGYEKLIYLHEIFKKQICGWLIFLHVFIFFFYFSFTLPYTGKPTTTIIYHRLKFLFFYWVHGIVIISMFRRGGWKLYILIMQRVKKNSFKIYTRLSNS